MLPVVANMRQLRETGRPGPIAGIVLGILALLGVASYALTAVSALAFGAALMPSAQSVRRHLPDAG
ncbi:MAG: hypothetical protein ACYDAE_07730 [Steroidobacteraceae bacterium]